ncbi:hypothetical protein [Galliscardovia ingluviei]|nr:hypothetical protein [Galliscardovia ingluviei]
MDTTILCPVCVRGHATTSTTLEGHYAPNQGKPVMIWFRAWYAECSNTACPARTFYPQPSEQSALYAFEHHDFLLKRPVTDLETGRLLTPTDQWLEHQIGSLVAGGYSKRRLKQLGLPDDTLGKLLIARELKQLERKPILRV